MWKVDWPVCMHTWQNISYRCSMLQFWQFDFVSKALKSLQLLRIPECMQFKLTVNAPAHLKTAYSAVRYYDRDSEWPVGNCVTGEYRPFLWVPTMIFCKRTQSTAVLFLPRARHARTLLNWSRRCAQARALHYKQSKQIVYFYFRASSRLINWYFVHFNSCPRWLLITYFV